MPNHFDAEGRGPSNRRLFGAGVALVLAILATSALMIAKYQGKLDNFVRITAELDNVGDGLPAKSDVKFRGVLVGSVSDVTPAVAGRPNVVGIDIKARYASGIPATVTARVIPSNVFAVSSVQLVDPQSGDSAASLRNGAVIHADQSLPTVLFQTTLNKFREVLAAVAREPSPHNIGWLTALGEATQGRGDRLETSGRSLNDIVTQLNNVVGDDTGPSTIAALADAANELRDASPELFDALSSAVQPMQTLAEKRSELTGLLSGALGTFGTVGDSFDNHTDRMIRITTDLTPVVGVLADHAEVFHGIAERGVAVARKFANEVWRADANALMLKGVIAFTPSRTYVRADCPRYGELAGPSCSTAPEIPTAPALTSALGSRGLPLPLGVSENRPNLAPPRDSVLPAPVPPEQPSVTPPDLPANATPPDLPANSTPPDDSAQPLPAEAPAAVAPQAGIIGGNVGPVGSRQEKDQLSQITGGEASAATVLLLGPLARGATVHLAPDPTGDR